MIKSIRAKSSRIYVQLAALVALHSSWGPEAKWLCNPVLSCHSCALSWFACPIGVFVHYAGWQIFPFLALGMVLLAGVLFGRLLCGWACPFGLLQDLLYRIPGPKLELPAWSRWIKYGVLGLMVFLLPFLLGELTEFSFCRICPASALQVTAPALIQGQIAEFGALFWARAGVLAGVLGLAWLASRSFCRVFCPIGALLAPLNFLSFWAVKPPTEGCISCKRCSRACPTDVQPAGRILAGTPPSRAADCVVCHDCQPVCPVPGRGKA